MKQPILKRLFWANMLLFPICTGALAATQQATTDSELIQRGEYLSRAGDCMACHSIEGKPAYSGGLAIKSGLGVIYSTNITPDKSVGIGNYSEQQFADAVRNGIRADGSHLYPAMPYPDYAKITDKDIHALYTYFMNKVPASSHQPPKTDLSFPFNQRWGMTFWNWTFGNDTAFVPIKGASEQVNRGAYLVEGLGHCGSCHTPRGIGMQEKAYDHQDDIFLSGGDLNGWSVPSLRGIPRWTNQEIVDYLQTGRNDKAGVGGEMTSVIYHSTSHMSEDDLSAIAVYLKHLGGNPALTKSDDKANQATTVKLTAAKNLTLGERLYVDNCGACHFVDGKGAPKAFPELDGASIINAPSPDGLVHIILQGAQLPSTAKAPSTLMMPGFSQRLNDKEVAELATFLRQGWSNHANKVTVEQVKKVRDSLEQDNKK
ncbi:c-type cytochrome [Vibrio sp. CAIM 722]|uniref:C-type cytochrome n=1 Tax=Vibrio eleionomae TaxID=2653505 RepID=A0A7X4LH81_9VIBR|nr:cytochrome c [Vibrio eleionomae]MZI91903.1 c-type cytochrome [Vibrio eleionomae]